MTPQPGRGPGRSLLAASQVYLGLAIDAAERTVIDYVAACTPTGQHAAYDTAPGRPSRAAASDRHGTRVPVRPGRTAGAMVRVGEFTLLRGRLFRGAGRGQGGRRDQPARGGNLQGPRGRGGRHVARAEPHVVFVPPGTPRRRRARPRRAESQQRYAARAARARLQRTAAPESRLPAAAAADGAARAVRAIPGR